MRRLRIPPLTRRSPLRRYRLEPAAGLDGRPVVGTIFKLSGQLVHLVHLPEQSPCSDGAEAREPSRLAELQRRVAAEVSLYRQRDDLSEADLRTIVALWQKGSSLRAFARQEGVTPQAIEDRIQRMRYKAVRFVQWWRRKNLMRLRR